MTVALWAPALAVMLVLFVRWAAQSSAAWGLQPLHGAGCVRWAGPPPR